MDQFIFFVSRALLVLFAIGVIGCILVIPATAAELFRVLFHPDSDEETAANSASTFQPVR